ncbi:acyltransferase family protein [Phyllobacterium ifriqiyense]|uniref:acyltransferase family protein n=1 Tax=Phyllobacterium ifriqiyense TaxID=314238 RepID=UPI003396C4AD
MLNTVNNVLKRCFDKIHKLAIQDIGSHNNNFDCIRFVAAFTVIWSHNFALMGLPEPIAFAGKSWGGVGVMVFFSLSGYLVARSWDRDPHLFRFAYKRALRIFPGLISVSLLMALIMGPIVTSLSMAEYFSGSTTWEFILGTATAWTLPDRLPGVFENHAVPTVNSSLWTIPVEIKWYGFLAFLGMFGVISHRYALPAMLVILIIFRFFLPFPYSTPVLIDLGLCFLAGAAIHSCREYLKLYQSNINALIGASIVIFWLLHMEQLAITIAIPFMVIAIGTLSTPYLRRFGRLGDLSYGMYIYAFPVQQMVVQYNTGSFTVNLVASVIPTVCLAWLSWHLVEKQALKLKEPRTTPPSVADERVILPIQNDRAEMTKRSLEAAS